MFLYAITYAVVVLSSAAAFYVYREALAFK